MADRYWSVATFGADKLSSIVESGSAQAGNPIELRVTYDATNNSKQRVYRALQLFMDTIARETWPPA